MNKANIAIAFLTPLIYSLVLGIGGYSRGFLFSEIFLMVITGIVLGIFIGYVIIWLKEQKSKRKRYVKTTILSGFISFLLFLFYGLFGESAITLTGWIFISLVFGTTVGAIFGFLIGYIDKEDSKKKNKKKDVKGQYIAIAIAIVFWRVVVSFTDGAVIAGLSLPVGWLIGHGIVKLMRKKK